MYDTNLAETEAFIPQLPLMNQQKPKLSLHHSKPSKPSAKVVPELSEKEEYCCERATD